MAEKKITKKRTNQSTGQRARQTTGQKTNQGTSTSKRKNQKQKTIHTYRAAGIAAAIIVVIGAAVWAALHFGNKPSSGAVQDGRQYLAQLEAMDVDSTVDKINQIKKKERREALESGEVSVWSQFYDYVILGDSRAVGFSYYEFLEDSRVLAEAGNTINVVPDRVSQVAALNPSSIFLCYGINDVSIGFYPTPDDYAQEMDKTVQLLQENFPNADIYINSIYPAKDPAFEQSEKWREIPDYNVAVKAMSEEKGYHYIDNTSVYEEHNDLYDIDGIHFQREFYDYWGANMLAEMDVEG